MVKLVLLRYMIEMMIAARFHLILFNIIIYVNKLVYSLKQTNNPALLVLNNIWNAKINWINNFKTKNPFKIVYDMSRC